MNERLRRCISRGPVGFGAALLFGLFAVDRSARAEVLFETFGPGDTFGSTAYFFQGNADGTAAEFTAGFQFAIATAGPASFDSIDVALSATGLVTAPATVQIRTDDGNRIGPVIETLSPFTPDPSPFTGVVSLVGSGQTVLEPGLNYWLFFKTTARAPGVETPGGFYGAMVSDPEVPGRRFFGFNDAGESGIYLDDSPLGAFRVLGTVIALPGDANGDGRVDEDDLAILAASWQAAGGPADGDFNGDGFVDVIDLGILADNWQVGAAAGRFADALGAMALPEPTSIVPVALGGLTLVRRRNSTHLSS